jgi:pyruvate/2-oxoglutarate/acetoin dehydrogenase E1 component
MRMHGHGAHDDMRYVPKELFEVWEKRDPVDRYEKKLSDDSIDIEAIRASVKETNRAIVVTEEPDLTSFGRHIHSWIAENFFWDLDTAPALVTAIAAPAAPYDAPEETGFYPTAEHIYAALERFSRE